MGKKVVVTLSAVLRSRGISLNELSLMTDVRRAALSELVNGKRENINFGHIAKVATALGISDIREIITLEDIGDEEQPPA
ncbi:helix-turn-helix domain-containing protein [Cohnella phaseoli]|uniref:Transcriptional regulator n=1 Tax=Cohnella phaseoli TaxID=456490 RepID=A0A3D9KIQ2_9BACL|nr:helix-turn-helix transcriptional regulator [Cohnella phaseoli]RED86190.1 transcriptional regulator [Cohnella phaseoli]